MSVLQQLLAIVQQLLCIVLDTCVYWGTFLYFWWWQQPISKLEIFGEQYLPRCHMYMLAKTLHLWDEPHYRAASFAEDLRDNLKNVAIPGTGNHSVCTHRVDHTALISVDSQRRPTCTKNCGLTALPNLHQQV